MSGGEARLRRFHHIFTGAEVQEPDLTAGGSPCGERSTHARQRDHHACQRDALFVEDPAVDTGGGCPHARRSGYQQGEDGEQNASGKSGSHALPSARLVGGTSLQSACLVNRGRETPFVSRPSRLVVVPR